MKHTHPTNLAARGVPLILAALLGVLLCGPVSRADDESLANVVPADVGFFIELRDAADLLLPLTDPQAWLTVAELAGQPADVRETGAWERRIRQTVRMTPAEAIRTLFARRVAYVSEGLRTGQDAVVLCAPGGDLRDLVRRWPATPLPSAGRASMFRLPNNVGVGIFGDYLVLGDISAHSSFSHVLESLEAKAPTSLAADPVYRRLLARVPEQPVGVLFARLTRPAPTSAPASAPASAPTTEPAQSPAPTTAESRSEAGPLTELPALLRGSSNILLALHREDGLLHFTAVGDAAGDVVNSSAHSGSLTDLVATLPERTLLAWAGHVDYSALSDVVKRLPAQHALRLAYQVQERGGTIERITHALNSATCVAVGVVTPQTRRLPAPPIPAAALLISARDPGAAATELGVLLESSVALYKLLSLQYGTPPLSVPTTTVDVDGCLVQQFDFSEVLGPLPALTPMGEIHLSWAVDNDVLILATHTDWIRQIIAARHGAAARLEHVLELTRRPATERRDTIVVAQTGPIADLGQLWLDYARILFPQILQESWWRQRQPGGPNVRLGIQVVQEAEQKRLRVTSVTAGMPADGILKAGDEILGVHPHRFRTDRPLLEIGDAILNRRNARWVDLIIERDRIVHVRRIAVPFVDPPQVLRRIVSVGEIAQRIVYHDDVPDAEGPRGYLTLEMRAEHPPLFKFAVEPDTPPAELVPPETPASEPAPAVESQPAPEEPTSEESPAVTPSAESQPAEQPPAEPPAESQPAEPAPEPAPESPAAGT